MVSPISAALPVQGPHWEPRGNAQLPFHPWALLSLAEASWCTLTATRGMLLIIR